MRFRTIEAGPWVPPGEQAAYRVISRDNWSQYYPAEPAGADFNSRFYVVAYRGAKPNPGYEIRIARVGQSGNNITVTVELTEPDPDRFYPQVIVNPISVAEVIRADLGPAGDYKATFVDQRGNTLAEVTTRI